MIYLDNAASTIPHNDVISFMLPYLKEQYGNPSSIHRYGRLSEKAIKNARKDIAKLINADPKEILLTSGGTESNNTALFGVSNLDKGHIITSSIEHPAILEPCAKLESMGFKITYLAVDQKGMINLDELKSAITLDTCLVSIMLANNEVGTIQPIKQISDITRARGVLLHTDAIQAVGKMPIDVKELGVDMLSMSSHKINGPKGVGALYIKDGLDIKPIIFGGGQEDGLRSGTENVSSIVGFGKACQLAYNNLDSNIKHMQELRDYLVEKIQQITYCTFNGNKTSMLPNNAHFTFLGINGEDLIIKLDEHNIAASTGSACSIKTQKASHVLEAMGFSHEQITGSLRLSIGIFNTREEIDITIETLKQVIVELRKVSPFKEKYEF